ncbi:hypothetical protein M5D96_013533 [Drosophila gunungcola]|uniref:Uncharacterized protein n=1 Tax=Drosophila gunungcola TaxID=103775 RepID=A0A9Q0BJA1_9MUSC|nr:hypothetical protein M5D96_013533 [Drosophila gunungcola]
MTKKTPEAGTTGFTKFSMGTSSPAVLDLAKKKMDVKPSLPI